ncbi:MAG: translation initiation factor IF-2 [Candidatus Bipolaricaulis sp.]|nr:translation initiation factor IF-2 [Candidatus Bipolaricaulis sp.]
MGRKRVYEIARELDVSSKDLISKLEEMGLSGMKAANSVDEEEYTLIVNLYREERGGPATSAPEKSVSEKQPEAPRVEAAPKTPRERVVHHGDPRPPVVSVLGHIDHGKTTLLDAIRSSHLAEKEAGGITQGVAAYQVDLRGKKITFLDTPGHKAFTGMRARGAQATDIAVLVVAADDGVMAQTVEAIDHIRAAGIPMVVAINKTDKPNADVNKVLGDLAEHGLTPEVWGGETITVEISALQGTNIEELLEMILLVAEMEDLRADPKAATEAVIIESHLSAGRGPVATAIVRNGTLHEKDWVVAGGSWGRVKALLDETGTRRAVAQPGEAVQILGFGDVPMVGTSLAVVASQAEAKSRAENQADALKPKRVRRVLTLDELFENAEEERVRLELVLKASSTGGLEAARRELDLLHIEGVELGILHAGVGAITESDILLAASVAQDAFVVGFGVKPDAKAARLAEQQGIVLLSYDIIYDLVDEITRALKRRLAPEYEEIQMGIAEVRNLFKIPSGRVAGCAVVDGKVTRRSRIRVLRGDKEMFVGEIASLRRFEEDAREVLAGRECGIHLKDFDDVEVGDKLIAFELKEIER